MKTHLNQKMESGKRKKNTAACAPNSFRTPHSALRSGTAFTLIELLVVISIIGVLAAFTIPVMHSLKRQQYIRNAQAEMQQLETALDNYKAKYGFYPPGNGNINTVYLPANDRSQFSQLYYELSGVTHTNKSYTTLDGASTITEAQYQAAFGVGGVVNTSMGGGEDAASAKNFLAGLKSKQIYYPVTNNGIPTTMLITSVGGPDPNYQPLNAEGLNPFRYVYPGTNNPNSYDLWVQLSIGSSFTGVNAFVSTNKYLICNWSKSVPVNSPLP
jgi:prepilin-type N-terminal cleavage/methylation domain-containing protein